MEYIKNCDYDYIMNKYHDQDKPFNAHRRFIRHDEIFEESTGMAGDDIIAGILQQDATLTSLPHPVRKAKAFAYVLKHTRISCDVRDIFPAINMIDRPLNKTLVNPWKKEVFDTIIPEVGKQCAVWMENGAATLRPDYDHSVPVWERIFQLGFVGLLQESEKARSEKAELTPEQDAFYEGVAITYNAILDFLARLENQAQLEGNCRMATALSNLRVAPPATFYEALLTDYLYFMLNEHIEGLQVRSLSNFDRLFCRFYQNDLEKGVTEAQIRKDLAYFFLQFTAIGNYWNQPVYLGGCKEDESTQINPLSYLFLDVYDKMNIYNPKVQIKVAASTPKDFLLKALDMIRRGRNSIVFVGDATIRQALQNAGATPEQARLCDVKGCYEYAVVGTLGSEMNYVNLMKPLEYALHRGHDGITGDFSGLESPEDYPTFEAFFAEYKRQLGYLIQKVTDTVNAFEDYLAYINPQSMISATCQTCIDMGADTLAGGATMNVSNMMFGFIANVADSLVNIKKYVFDKQMLTIPQLRDILDANFAGNEKIRLLLLSDRDKYGNNKSLPDEIAKEIVGFICQCVCGKANAKNRNGRWNVGFHVARQSYDQGEKTAASPDGRWRGEELSKNMSASMGRNREGATAAILSVTKIDATAFASDAPLDLGLLPSAVQGEDGLEAMYGLLMTFIKRGGHAMHINVFNAETLRDAQTHPEKYQDLQIRVCGWNVLWNNINKAEQDEFIRQAESLV